MVQTTIFPGRYVQGPGCLSSIGKEAHRLGKHSLVLVSPFVKKNLLQKLQPALEEFVQVHIVDFRGQCSDEEIDRIRAQGSGSIDLVIGIGGGKTLDTAKVVAYEKGLPVIIAPTIASTDAPCSALSVIYTPQGQFKRLQLFQKNPDVVLVDTEVIARAPVRFLVAGMGDALATYFEAESCYGAYRRNMTGNFGSLTAVSLARLCFDTVLAKGWSAKQACEANVSTPALEQIVEANTLLSGLGFESGGLASAHAIHNGFTALESTQMYLHGEKVAMGVLAGLVLANRSQDLVQKVYSFCEEVGLPTTLADIGLVNVSDTDIMTVAKVACAEGETIHNEPFPVTPETVFAALKAADAQGQARK